MTRHLYKLLWHLKEHGLRSLLFQVDPLDPVILSLAAMSIFLLALAASVIPARRAASIEPMQALRDE